MIEYTQITQSDYAKCYDDMNGEMNVSAIECLNEILTGIKGLHEKTHPDRVVHPSLDCHDEFFRDKKEFLPILAKGWEDRLRPTLSNDDKIEFSKIVKSIDDSKDMIELVWCAEQLLNAIRSVKLAIKDATRI